MQPNYYITITILRQTANSNVGSAITHSTAADLCVGVAQRSVRLGFWHWTLCTRPSKHYCQGKYSSIQVSSCQRDPTY